MKLRLNLQWKLLLLVAGTTTLILLVSAYLHGVFTNLLIEEYRYDNAVSQVVTVAKRAETNGYFGSPADLLQEIDFLVKSRPDFHQIDVYQTTPAGEKLIVTTAPNAQRLPYLNQETSDNEFGEMERPLPDVVSVEVERDGVRLWVISATINEREGGGYVSALVSKTSRTDFISRLQFRHNVVLAVAVVGSIALLYLWFAILFRRPLRDIVSAMARARAGNLSVRAQVRRDDELGAIASGFNRMIEDIRVRDEEREQLLSQVRNFNDELQNEVSRATKQLRASNEDLLDTQQRLARSERLAAIGQVAASLAHEIGTPLNAISGHLRLIARSHQQDIEMRRRVEIINSQLDSVVKSVKNLLTRTQRPRPEFKPFDLNALVQELLWLVQPTLDSHDIKSTVHLDTDLPLLWADRDSLLQLFLNLTNNSIEAMPSGGDLSVTTRFDRMGRSAEILFCDSGVGLDPSAINNLFEPMWTTKETGSGFGLAIAHQIALEHDGRIEIMTEQHEGVTFRITLPINAEARLLPEVVIDVA
jgi:two-component system, NtrC family, sensor kinase